jgi:hypothetical protein
MSNSTFPAPFKVIIAVEISSLREMRRPVMRIASIMIHQVIGTALPLTLFQSD